MADAGQMTSESLSVLHDARPFKAAAYVEKHSASGTRRNKTLKQILNQERDAFLQRRGLDKKRADDAPAKRARTADADDAPEPPTQDVAPAPARSVPTCTSLASPRHQRAGAAEPAAAEKVL